jgi:hypothetical protein
MGDTKDSQSMKEDGLENTTPTSENTANPTEKDFQVTMSSKEKPTNTDIAKMIQMFAEKLVKEKYLEWHKIVLKDGRKGYALFFDNLKWELVDNQIVEIKL